MGKSMNQTISINGIGTLFIQYHNLAIETVYTFARNPWPENLTFGEITESLIFQNDT